MENRLKKNSVSLIAILLMVILIVLPTGYEDAVIFKGTDKVKAKVVSTDESTVKSSGLIQSGEQFCQVELLGGKFKGETTLIKNRGTIFGKSCKCKDYDRRLLLFICDNDFWG